MTDLPPIDLAWEAPAECPTLSGVRRAIERLLGKPLDALPARNVHAQGSVKKNDAGNWELQLSLTAGDHVETETLVAKKCRSLSDAMALKVALAIDPLALIDPVPPEPAAPAENPPAAAPEAGRPAEPARSDVGFGLRGVAGVGVGPLPGVTPGVALYGSLQFPLFRLELGAEAAWGGVARYDALPNVGADLSLLAGALRGCGTPGSGRWLFPICIGAELGIMRGSGFGVAASATTRGVWGGVSAGPALQFRVTSTLSLWVETQTSLTLLKPEFHMRNLGTLYRPPALGGRAALGFELKF